MSCQKARVKRAWLAASSGQGDGMVFNALMPIPRSLSGVLKIHQCNSCKAIVSGRLQYLASSSLTDAAIHPAFCNPDDIGSSHHFGAKGSIPTSPIPSAVSSPSQRRIYRLYELSALSCPSAYHCIQFLLFHLNALARFKLLSIYYPGHYNPQRYSILWASGLFTNL